MTNGISIAIGMKISIGEDPFLSFKKRLNQKLRHYAYMKQCKALTPQDRPLKWFRKNFRV